MTLRRFNKDLLDKICNEQNIVLLQEYDNNNLGWQAVIEFKCIEVKSTWTFKKKKDNIFLKQLAAKNLGYNYEIWVYDSKGNKIETYL